MIFTPGEKIRTCWGWTPRLRRLVSWRLCACGCLTGTYEANDQMIVTIIDDVSKHCHATHALNQILNVNASVLPRDIERGQ